MKPPVPNLLRRHLNISRYWRLANLTVHSLRTHGLRVTSRIIVRKIRQKAGIPMKRIPASDPLKNRLSFSESWGQKSWSKQPGYRPEFQLVLPLSGHVRRHVLKTVRSLARQTYSGWTLLIISDPNADQAIRPLLSKLAKADPRIRLQRADFDSTPHAALDDLSKLEGDGYVGLIREGDSLTKDALYRVARVLERQPELDVAYTDEGHLSSRGNRLDHLVLKPDWSPEMLLGYNYPGSLCVFRRSVFDDLGGFDPEHNDAMEWDLCLRFLEQSCRFKRVPFCCYLRSGRTGKIPWGTATKENAADFEAVLEKSLDRQGLAAKAEVCENGTFRLRWQLAEQPSVSVIIPNKDSYRLIRSIVDDLMQRTDYANKEIIIVDNFSQDARVREFYRQQTELGNIRVVEFNRPFNYSAACNAGARAASGDVLLFLNNDMEVVSPDWIQELVGWIQQPQVGVVGAKLLYPNGSLQHCGLAFGLNNVAHLWHKAPSTTDWDMFGTPNSYRNYLAVTGACHMIKRALFEEIGGYDERYQIVFSDVAICLNVWELGYRIVCTPHASLIHFESYTRDEHVPVPDVQLMAGEIRRLNVREDPFFHPGLDPHDCEPTPRSIDGPSSTDELRRFVDTYDLPDWCFVPLDLFDEEELRQAGTSIRADFGHPTYCPVAVSDDVWQAVRFVLYVLLKNKDVRTAFPKALSEGVDGGFFRWLCDAGLAQYRIPGSAEATIRQAFLSKPGDVIRNLYASRSDLLQVIPAALLPSGQRRFLGWLLHHAAVDVDLRNEEILWFLLEAAEDPVREIAYSYRISATWQRAFPAGVTAFAYGDLFDWLEELLRLDPRTRLEAAFRWREVTLEEIELAYRHNPDWQSRFPQAFKNLRETFDLVTWTCSEFGLPRPDLRGLSDSAGQLRLSLNVLAHFCEPSPFRQSARALVESLETAGIDVSVRDVPIDSRNYATDRSAFLGLETHDVSLIHVEPIRPSDEPIFKTALEKAGLAPRRNVYRIGLSSWELEHVPSDRKTLLKTVNELWAPTQFAADAMSQAESPRILPMLPGVALGAAASVRGEDFGVDDEDYLFVFLLDMNSLVERKNPFALIEAHKKAFRRDDRAKLLIAVASGESNPTDLKRLKRASRSAGVLLVERVNSPETLSGLIETSDCYVSLHRAESFGLSLAEAMMRGKPVIATGYSGNLEYMDETNAMLVDYQLRPFPGKRSERKAQIFEESRQWAEPSVEHAADLMRWVYEHREEAEQIGLRGQAHVDRVLSPEASAARIQTRLAQIYEGLWNNGSATQQRRAA